MTRAATARPATPSLMYFFSTIVFDGNAKAGGDCDIKYVLIQTMNYETDGWEWCKTKLLLHACVYEIRGLIVGVVDCSVGSVKGGAEDFAEALRQEFDWGSSSTGEIELRDQMQLMGSRL